MEDINSPLGNSSTVWKYFDIGIKDGSTNKTYANNAIVSDLVNTTNMAGHVKKKDNYNIVSYRSKWPEFNQIVLWQTF